MLTLTEARDRVKNMNYAELRAEADAHYKAADAIEQKYQDGPITDAQDAAQSKALLDVTDILEDALQPFESAVARKNRISGRIADLNKPTRVMIHPTDPEEFEMARKSPGEQFIQSEEFKSVLRSGRLNSPQDYVQYGVALKGMALLRQLEMNKKALLFGSSATGGAPFVQNDVQPGLSVPLLQREITVLDLIPRTPTTSDAIEYVQEDTFTNSAAPTAEATATTGTSGTKPESTLAYSTKTALVKTIPHWIPVTNRMLADAPAMRGIIDNRLLLGLELTLESQIITGDGTGENFTGILGNAGINVQGIGTDNQMDALFKGRTLVRTTGKSRPTGIVLNPADWQDIRLARENVSTATQGQYLMGPPSMVGPSTLWGLPVVESEGIAAGTGLVGDFAMGAMLFDREQAQIRVGLINDQFIRNMQTILAELRAALVVWRGAAFAKVTGI